MNQQPDASEPTAQGVSELTGTKASLENVNGDRFQKIIEEVQDYAIIFLEADGTVSTWNKGAEEIKGYKANEIIGKNFRIFYPVDDKNANFPEVLLDRAAKNGKTNHEGWRIRKDGTRFWGNVTITAIHGDNGEVVGFLKVTRDLTERRIAEDSFSNYTEEIRIKNEELRRSEERYHKMVAEIRDYAIILMDRDGKILDWNKGAEQLKGYAANEIIGKSFRLFYPREDRDSGLPDQLLNEAVVHGSVIHEGWRVRKDGNRFWGFVSITALHDGNGEVIGFSKITRDLTEKKIAEEKLSNYVEELKHKNEQLRLSEERYYRMIEEVEDYAIIFLNLNGDIQNWNSGAEKINGYSRFEVIGQNFRIFYTAADLERRLPETLLRQAVEHGKAVSEGYRIRKDGTRFWASVVITALHDKFNRVIGFSKVTRDLSERKKAEEALDLKNKDLEQVNGELSSFAFVASHDLKEPLRKIQVFMSRIEEVDHLSEKSTAYVHKIRHSAGRMQRLIDDLLSFSKLTRTDDATAVDLNQVVAEVKNDLEIPITERKASVIAGDLPKIRGISFQLHQLFFNLISNSLKFARTDIPSVIQVSYDIVQGPVEKHGVGNDRSYHLITLTDNGIGFESSEAARIFDVFYRLHSREKFEGTGIGLAIVKKVVENHHGYIATEGSPGAGASFFIYLPAA